MTGDIPANVAQAADLIREAARAGARLVLFAEKFLSGYEPELIRTDPGKYPVGLGDPRLAPIAEACRETGTAAIVGAAVQDGADLRISALVLGPDGGFVTRYDKQHLFKSEREHYRPGTAGCTVEPDGWHTCGGSAVWGPDGRLVAEASEDRRELVVADLDPVVLRTTRETETLLADLALDTGRPPAPGPGSSWPERPTPGSRLPTPGSRRTGRHRDRDRGQEARMAATALMRPTRRAGSTAAARPTSTVRVRAASTGRTGGVPTVPTVEVTERAAAHP